MTSTIANVDRSKTVWRKSSRSGGNGCVEVAFIGKFVVVRDSKDPSGPLIMFTHAEWNTFLGGVRDGEFDLLTRSRSAIERAERLRDEQVTVLYVLHHKAVRRYLIGQGCRESDAEDIVQDSILIVRQRWLRLGAVKYPKAYWFKIAVRLMWRLQQRYYRRFSSGLDHAGDLLNPGDDVDGMAMVDGQETALSMVRLLAPRQCQVVWLRCVEGFTEAETADILSISVGTVKSQLYDGKTRLKDLLANAGEPGEETG